MRKGGREGAMMKKESPLSSSGSILGGAEEEEEASEVVNCARANLWERSVGRSIEGGDRYYI